MESPFDASMMTHFRKRIPRDMIQRICEKVFCAEAVASMDNEDEADSEESEDEEGTGNRGTLILDATCCPADIHYPTDAGLLNKARELAEEIVDKLHPTVRNAFPEKPRMYRQVARKKYLAYAKKRRHTEEETRRCIREESAISAAGPGVYRPNGKAGCGSVRSGEHPIPEADGNTGTVPAAVGDVPEEMSSD